MEGVFLFSSEFYTETIHEFSIFRVQFKDYSITVEYKTNTSEMLKFDLTVEIMSEMVLYAGAIEFKLIGSIFNILYHVG